MNPQLTNPTELIDRFNKTLDILIPTLNYVDTLDEAERDFCEETFYQIAPCYLFMYSVVVKDKLPDAYQKTEAQLEIFEQIKLVAQISAATYKSMRSTIDNADQYKKGFYALLETYLLLYYAYLNGLPK